ncbi:hypothetical protein LCGC14_2995130 [marine sediment metagenome]|uniref:HTH cro/C1-type domain-containing protein n=1 Tax=marine sediment metagenome TaxID=412755 RepID=A0A0F8ZA95_9ZZZZ
MLTVDEVRLELWKAVETEGTQKAWAENRDLSPQYISDVLNGRREPGPLILAGLGLRRVVTYEVCD